jgi:outer membrane lipoprotein SlyB
MKSQLIFLFAIVCGFVPASLFAQHQTEKGAVLGGLAGAAAGAAIGDHNGNAGAGALIGTALGFLTGAAIGDSIEQENARARAIEQQRLYQLSRAVTVADVVTMTRNGLGDSVIINHILENGVQRRLEVPDVISLHQQGVSESVISAMQKARLATQLPPPAHQYRPPVIVEEHRYIRPPVYWPGHVGYRYHYHQHHRHRPSFHWGITFGN